MLQSQPGTRDQRVYPSQTGGWSYTTPQELKLQKGRQVGREDPPAGLLVSRKGTRMPAVLSLVTMFLVKPAETRRSGRSASRSWSQRTLGRRNLDGVGNLESQDGKETWRRKKPGLLEEIHQNCWRGDSLLKEKLCSDTTHLPSRPKLEDPTPSCGEDVNEHQSEASKKQPPEDEV